MLLRIYDIYFFNSSVVPKSSATIHQLSQPEEKQKNFKGSDELI